MTKISAASEITTLAGTDELAVASSGASRRVSWENIKASLRLGVASPAAGETLVCDGTNFVNVAYAPKRSALQLSGSLYENIPRYLASQATAVTSQRLMLTAIELPKGITVTSLSFASGATALNTGVHQFFGLYDSSRARLAVSADATSAAWAANTVKTLAMTSPFVTTYTGLHYAACLVQATTMPTLLHLPAAIPTALQAAPVLCGQADSSITAMPANAASISTVFAGIWWCQVN